nr:hypothetical protein [Tanacetum cinerariifolium]
MSNVYSDVEIEINDSTFRIDLIPIMLGVFDIVIGMDWLDKYDANILCSQKLVRVLNPQGQEITIYGDKRNGEHKICSVMKARRYLSRGCHAFMAHVIDTSFEKKSEKDVPVVNKFLDVFLEDLSGIPPERQSSSELILFWEPKIWSFIVMHLTPVSDVFLCNGASKANVVADTLSRKEREGTTRIHSLRMIVTSDLFNKIKAGQVESLKEDHWKNERITSYIMQFEDDCRGIKTRQGSIYIPFRNHVKELLLEEAYKSKYLTHPGATKMYLDLKRNYWCIKMPPYEMLYGRKCQTQVCWEEPGSRELASTDVVLATTKKIETIQESLKAAQDRWKSYAENRRRPIEFNVGDFIMLKVSPWKGVLRFKNKGKLSLGFIGPFKNLKRVGEVAYVLELPKEMRGVHNTFHVSYLRKCLSDESSMITLDDVEIDLEITT